MLAAMPYTACRNTWVLYDCITKAYLMIRNVFQLRVYLVLFSPQMLMFLLQLKVFGLSARDNEFLRHALLILITKCLSAAYAANWEVMSSQCVPSTT